MSVTNDMSGIVAHNLSGLVWSLLEVADEMDRDATGDPEDAIRVDVFWMECESLDTGGSGADFGYR